MKLFDTSEAEEMRGHDSGRGKFSEVWQSPKVKGRRLGGKNSEANVLGVRSSVVLRVAEPSFIMAEGGVACLTGR